MRILLYCCTEWAVDWKVVLVGTKHDPRWSDVRNTCSAFYFPLNACQDLSLTQPEVWYLIAVDWVALVPCTAVHDPRSTISIDATRNKHIFRFPLPASRSKPGAARVSRSVSQNLCLLLSADFTGLRRDLLTEYASTKYILLISWYMLVDGFDILEQTLKLQ